MMTRMNECNNFYPAVCHAQFFPRRKKMQEKDNTLGPIFGYENTRRHPTISLKQICQLNLAVFST